ncbi:hypothetical protein [Streptomyces sp. NPDC050145]|uniref:hypothetical protein n=1 Tax=Streptomyces sp. NPDC050145 TaxID=3365602 RepID=UPI003797CEC9
MGHHHKPNREVGGDPDRDSDHGRGLPRRPDSERLDRRTERDRRAVGLPDGAPEPAAVQYEEAHAEIDRQAASGQLPTGDARRAERDAYPPSRYDR